MPRRALTATEKKRMQEGRNKASKEREEAQDFLEDNDQFINPVFWKSVNLSRLLDVEDAILQAKEENKQKRIRELQSELERLER